MKNSDMILRMDGVTKRFPGVVALNSVSIDVRRGEILAICGENGAGKSTLMKVLSGSYASHEYDGEISVEGRKVEDASVRKMEALGVQMVYQELNMMLDASIAENLFVGNLPGAYGVVDYKRLYGDTAKILETLKFNVGPKERARMLNSGQLQMLSIYRALIRKPRIMVLDEPTSALTDREVETLMGLMRDMKSQGVAIIFITHKLEEVFEIADRVVVMRDGSVISSRSVKEATKDLLIEEMVGRKIENLYPKEKVPIGEEILKIEHLSVPHPTIQNHNIVEEISFSLRRGEILGIGGLMGSGRSETLGAIFGQITKGVKKDVYVDGKKVRINKPVDALNAGIGFVTEERKKSGYVWNMTVRENLTLANLRRLPGRLFIHRKAERDSATEMFNRMRVKAPSIETTIVNLSGGNQQKVVLGKWLVAKPRILLIDEPTKGIDVGAKSEIYRLMNELVREGMSIIMATSDMPELVSMSDRCLVLSNSRITGEFCGDEITQDNIMRAAIMH